MKKSFFLVMVMVLATLLTFSAMAAQGAPKQAEAVYAATAPRIDGTVDDMWEDVPAVTDLEDFYNDGHISGNEVTASIKFMWDSEYLYVLAEVNDPSGVQVDNPAAYQNDGVAIFIDEFNEVEYAANPSIEYKNKAGFCGYYYDVVADSTMFNHDNTVPAEAEDKYKFAATPSSESYIVEMAIPFIQISPVGGEVIGMDIEIEINLGNGVRESKLNWSDTTSNAFRFADGMGELTLLAPEGGDVTPDDTDPESLAEDLKTLGLFIGTENGFELDRAPTRIEALVMLIRLLGVESDAKNGTWSHPFTDVPDWADPYVGYAYEKGLTAGVSDTLFGTDELSNAAQYLTFVLRALGYSDAEGDFVWNKSNEKAAEIGLIGADDYPDLENGEFLRADTVIISYSALSVNMKDTETSLVASLIDKGAVDADLAADLGLTK